MRNGRKRMAFYTVGIWKTRQHQLSSGQGQTSLSFRISGSMLSQQLMWRDFLEKRMLQSFLQRDPFWRLVLQHFEDQVKQVIVLRLVTLFIPLKIIKLYSIFYVLKMLRTIRGLQLSLTYLPAELFSSHSNFPL